MSTTTSHTHAERLTPAGHVMASVAAVMQHGIDHALAAPHHIFTSRGRVELYVPIHTFRAWRDSLVVESESSQPAALSFGGPTIRCEATGTIPATGVRVTVSGYMLTDRRPLEAVASAGAEQVSA